MVYKKNKRTKKQKEITRKRTLIALVVTLIFFVGYGVGKNGWNQSKWTDTIQNIEKKITDLANTYTSEPSKSMGSATIRVLDVGQGSATLLQSEDGVNILIDTGRDDDKDKKIIQSLDKYIGTGGQIDLLIFTHNHADHLGYGDQILSYYRVKEVWMNGLDTTTKVYERVLDAIAASDAIYTEPVAGEKAQVGPFYLKVLNPLETRTKDQNDNSIVLAIEVNEFSLMLTGDASTSIEKKILEREPNVKSDVLILGHHGSSYSSHEVWLESVNPDVGIYSAGIGNIYDHPSPETVKRIEERNIPLYGTDTHGEVTLEIKKDGAYSVHVKKGDTIYENGSGDD